MYKGYTWHEGKKLEGKNQLKVWHETVWGKRQKEGYLLSVRKEHL